MKIKVEKANGKMIYFQDLEGNNAATPKVVAFLMSQVAGDEVTSTLSNNGHDLVFKNNAVDVEALIRTVNSIIIRTPATKTANPV